MRLAIVLGLSLMLCGCVTSLAQGGDPPVMHKVAVNSAEISYVDSGAGETVVFLHGVGTDLRIWDHVRPYFAGRYRFVAYSRRFHSPNAWPADDGDSYTIRQHAEDLAALINVLGVKKAHVVSTSIGGRVAMELAFTHPELVASVVVGDAYITVEVPPQDEESLKAFGRRFAPVAAAIQSGNQSDAATQLVGWLFENDSAWAELPDDRKLYYSDNAKTLQLTLRDRTIGERPDCIAIGRIQIPVLVLDGRNTAAAFRLTNDSFYKCLPATAQRVSIPYSAHAWYVDNPGEGSEAILRFLARHPIQ
jgi:pimeloyl-ACP methyl ester carboxylesterase